jgi:hypothetical protein
MELGDVFREFKVNIKLSNKNYVDCLYDIDVTIRYTNQVQFNKSLRGYEYFIKSIISY